MDARLTDEQKQMQETAEDFLESNGGIEFARERMDGNEEIIDELWADLAGMDYTAITVPLDHGGLGEGMVYLSAILESLGQYAMPGPYPETMGFVVPLLAELGDDDQQSEYLPAIVNGDVRASFALYDEENESLPRSVQLTADRVNGGYRLSGTKKLVPYGGEVDLLVLAARTRAGLDYEGISLFLVEPDADGVKVSRQDSLDRCRPSYEITLQDHPVSGDALLGPVHGGGTALERASERFTVAAGAMLVGAADRAVDLSVVHGNEREQYGQPIGRFQAVKHRVANMWIDMQCARSLVYYAAWALDEDDPDASRAVSATKGFVADRLHRAFADGIKNHGGMGFTWDHDGHIYLKQAKAWRNFLGSPESHNERVIEARLASLED